MGLLAVLDFHRSLKKPEIAGEYEEVEYRLYSWGEIFPPFFANREHSIVARYILQNFPFKLFSSSTPYVNPLPQKLCLTFRPPHEVRKDTKTVHVSGIFPNEIAKEFAAFLSLVSRRRVFVGKQIRYHGLPIEQEVNLYQRSHFQERQSLKEINPKEIYQLLENLQAMDRHIADGFILAMRLYHSAIEMMYTEPEFSYLFLVTSLEAISSVIYEEHKPSSEEGFLNSRFPGWQNISNALSLEKNRVALRKLLLKNEKFTFQKLSEFVNKNVPERFWSETKDDAKPDYYIHIMGPGPDGLGQKHISRSNSTIQDWEKIEKGSLIKVLRSIYSARSDLVHRGIRLPASIIIGHFRGMPPEALDEMMPTSHKNRTKPILQIPPLLTFERLVSYSMVEFLRKQQGMSKNSTQTHDVT